MGLSSPAARVGVLTAGMAVAAAGVTAVLARHGVAAPDLPGGGWWLLGLGALFALTEGFTVYVRVRRGAHAINLSEFPMVLGLLVFDPVTVILARALAGGLGLRLLRRQRGPKLAFNVALLAVQASVAVLVFRALAPHATAAGLDPRSWLGAYAAMVLADVVAAVLLTAVIAMHDDPGEWRRLPATLRSVWMVVVTTTTALVSYAAASQDRWALALVALVAVVLFLAYRAYDRLGQGNAEVQQLYAFTSALDGARPVDDLLTVVLGRLRDVLRAENAELVVPGEDGVLRHHALRGPATGTVSELGWPAEDAWLGPALTAGEPVLTGDRMAVPIGTLGERAVLVVTGGMSDSEPFGPERLTLFRALANHASAALGRAHLVDRLRSEVEEKRHLALHDPLSGLPNRRYFQQLLDEALATARGSGGGVAVMLLDLDRFSEINDALGHDTGDGLLREVGDRLRAHLAGRGVVARFGGDEFAVMLPIGSAEEAVAAAAELGAVVERGVRMDPVTVSARASIGVALAPQHGDDGQSLIRRADVAMYVAKDNHSGPRVYDPSADRHSAERLALITDLRAAVERRDLVVAFQPKVEPRTGRVVGAEALARWHHPELGAVPPDVFVPLAEHSGLIRPLTLHVLELALRRRAAWARSGHDLDVAVNLSPNSLLDAELPETVALLLAQTGNPPHKLTLEITEGTILADPAGSAATIERLHALGVKLSIDDFGTGYSSLGRLRQLPIHEVKIDKSFVQRSAADHRDRAVVRSAVQLGHALDLQVVAEGVEDREAYAYLATEGCDVVQGYLVSRPLAPDQFLDWVISYGTSLILSAGQDSSDRLA